MKMNFKMDFKKRMSKNRIFKMDAPKWASKLKFSIGSHHNKVTLTTSWFRTVSKPFESPSDLANVLLMASLR